MSTPAVFTLAPLSEGIVLALVLGSELVGAAGLRGNGVGNGVFEQEGFDSSIDSIGTLDFGVKSNGHARLLCCCLQVYNSTSAALVNRKKMGPLTNVNEP